jgi:hypothetical protein
LSLAQGKCSQFGKQQVLRLLVICSQFLILHAARYFDFWVSRLSMLRHPGHEFFSRIYPQHRRQFIPQGAIKFVGIAVIFFLLGVIIVRAFNAVFGSVISPAATRNDPY